MSRETRRKPKSRPTVVAGSRAIEKLYAQVKSDLVAVRRERDIFEKAIVTAIDALWMAKIEVAGHRRKAGRRV